jgi:hypothetical protein
MKLDPTVKTSLLMMLVLAACVFIALALIVLIGR